MIKTGTTKHNFIVEDDIILIDTYINNFNECLGLIKKMEYDRATRNTVYPDSVENLNKNEENKRKTLLSRFFAKNK